MPTFDFKCGGCGSVFERVTGMRDDTAPCPNCSGEAVRQFSPNRNILIPGYFRMDRGWHLPPDGGKGSSPDTNSRVHAAPKTSFKQQFDKNWSKAGGG
jgi:putative FmdB family regulatory protein